jgi:hypothetical protein
LKDGDPRADLGSSTSTPPRAMPGAPVQHSTHGADGDTRTQADDPLDPEERRRRIELQAYLLFIDRGAAPGAALDDWLTAERQVDWRG